jgi:filamentous hemagglutinin
VSPGAGQAPSSVTGGTPPNAILSTGNGNGDSGSGTSAQGGKNTGMLGENGPQFASKTIWKGDGQERIDVENPNPGQRPGQIHYQDNSGNKYLYDPSTNSFPGAPNSVNKLLNNPSFSGAIQKGLSKYLGGN